MSALDVIEGRARWAMIHGDNREVLPGIPDKSITQVITDPPYSEHTHSKQRRGGQQQATDSPTGFPARVTSASRRSLRTGA